jgi:hypothetical protein
MLMQLIISPLHSCSSKNYLGLPAVIEVLLVAVFMIGNMQINTVCFLRPISTCKCFGSLLYKFDIHYEIDCLNRANEPAAEHSSSPLS